VPLPVEDVALAGGEPEADPESLLLSQEQQEAIQQALEGLRQRDRDLICRRHYRGESYKEIAAGMGMTVAHVGVALARAEQRLKSAFSALYPDLCEIR
jgi:RNA polymerase sigma factor (sigma-70 family)